MATADIASLLQDWRDFPSGARTPISDCIRDRLQHRAQAHAALFAGCGWERQAISSGSARSIRSANFFEDAKILPPFENSELDNPQLLASAAAEIYRMRRARDRLMPQGLVGEPAWDILLALYSEEADKLTVSSVCYGSGAPNTTALRWIGVLTRQGLVERTQHPRDARVILLSLTDQGRLVLERSLKAMLRASRS
jgi:DNA-binding MarR family transcriptional regulator